MPAERGADGEREAAAGCAAGVGLNFTVLDVDLTVFDAIGLGIAAVMIALLAGRAASKLQALAKQEPAAPRR